MIRATIAPTWESFRETARALLAAHVAPSDVAWDDGDAPLLFGEPVPTPSPADVAALRVPAAFAKRGALAALHRDPSRWDTLYRVAFRLTHGERDLLAVASDTDVAHLDRLVHAVRRDEHRMHAFVRFHEVDGAFVAFYEPEHDILALGAKHFVARFPSMRWAIVSSRRSVAWDGTTLAEGPGAPRTDAPPPDAMHELFRVYYGAIFNPARTNLALFEKHVPARFRADMPETAVVGTLARAAKERTRTMASKKTSPSLAFVPDDATHAALVHAARTCTACPLYENATQTVFGEGPVTAPLVLVGEQPGDQEDKQGHPFVGPAGGVLQAALDEAGIPRDGVYVTNAVKHFKWEPRGKRRIHAKPNAMEIHACHGWLEAELALVKPTLIVCLGATAAQALLGRTFRITKSRGELFDGAPWGAKHVMATYHPSALLRMDDDEALEQAKAHFAADLAKAASMVHFGGASRGRAASAGRAAHR